ncbi:DUF7282 domain-containing protein [Halorussus caseinilyticus]|uniref:BGTF surface domain-containing protein n=1 Tax=Halorussus caseinilyticus TaxID=3034025 RepID=A0ABD5WPF7_9EURY
MNVTGGRDGTVKPGYHFRANFSVAASSTLADDAESVTDEFEFWDRDADFEPAGNVADGEFEPDGGVETVRVGSAPNRTVRVETTLPPRSNVTVVVEGANDTFRFEESGRVRNASEGFVFAPTFDFSDVPPGTDFDVTLRHRDESVMGYGGPDPGVVVEPEADVRIAAVGASAANVTAKLPSGGFVVVRRDSVDGDRLGASDRLAPGQRNVSVEFDADLGANATLFAVAFRDADGDGEFDRETDEPYTGGKSDHRVAASKSVAFARSGVTETTTETTRMTDGPETAGTTSPPSTDTSLPGLGAGAALLALLAGLALARRKTQGER